MNRQEARAPLTSARIAETFWIRKSNWTHKKTKKKRQLLIMQLN